MKAVRQFTNTDQDNIKNLCESKDLKYLFNDCVSNADLLFIITIYALKNNVSITQCIHFAMDSIGLEFTQADFYSATRFIKDRQSVIATYKKETTTRRLAVEASMDLVFGRRDN